MGEDGAGRHGGPLGIDWIHAMTNACQPLIGFVECGHVDAAPAAAARDCLLRVPDPRTPAEEQFLRGQLIEIANRWSRRAHDRAHGNRAPGNRSGDCSFRTDTGFAEAWGARDRTAKAAFELWSIIFFDALAVAHRELPAVRAAKLILENHRQPLDVRTLARATGIQHVALRREFVRVFGISIREYHVRARVDAAIPLLRDPRNTSRMVAARVGYGSPKNFYRAVSNITGMSVSAVRRMTDAEPNALRAAVLPSPRGQDRGERSGRACTA